MKLQIAKALGLLVAFLLATGLIFPWIINNILLPISVGLVLLGLFFFVGIVLLKNPLYFLFNLLKEKIND